MLGPDNQWRSDSLVSRRPKYVGITLNYSPNGLFKIEDRKRPGKMHWAHLTPDQQRAIFEKHLREIYIQFFERIEYVFEFTKQGQLHCHAMGYIDDVPDGHDQFELITIQKTVAQHPLVLQYCKGNRFDTIHSNYIHYVEREKWRSYMIKNIASTPYAYRTMVAKKNTLHSVTDY